MTFGAFNWSYIFLNLGKLPFCDLIDSGLVFAASFRISIGWPNNSAILSELTVNVGR